MNSSRVFDIVATVFILLSMCACAGEGRNGGSAPMQSEPQPTGEPQQSPTETPPTAPEQPASGREKARAAFAAQRHDEVCAFLTTQRFSPEVCDNLVKAVSGAPVPLPRLEPWLATHRVKRVSGSIVSARAGASNEYDVRIGGEPAIMLARFTETELRRVNFEFWAQELESREIETAGGGTGSLPVYREWSLWFLIQESNRGSNERRAGQAREVVEHLIDGWESSYAAPPGLPPHPAPPPVPDAEPSPPATMPFAGVWFTTINPDVRLILTDTTYEHRFPYQGGVRRIRADIVETDVARGHITLRYTAVLQDGRPVEFEPGERFMHFSVNGTILRRRVAQDAFPTDFESNPWMRIPDQYVGPHDR